MAQFDPLMKRETWVFSQHPASGNGTREKIWQRRGFNFVSYDGNPDRYIEPVNMEQQMSERCSINDQKPAKVGMGSVVGFEFIDGAAYLDIHQFGL